ncbi:MAG TPA: hypothetical protein EYN66_04595, partial [Myxococcales bacterium]|nr:hypothetical protein [Myxococcales bacterium]
MNQGPSLLAGSTSATACAEHAYVFTYTPTGEETEGYTFLVIEASDVAGNRTDATREMSFDFSPPELTLIAFNPPNVREGMTATLLLTANEPLAGSLDDLLAPPDLRWVNDDFSLPLLHASGRTEFGWEYKWPIQGTPNGTYSIEFVILEDVVGNTQTITVSDLDAAQVTKAPDLTVDSLVPEVLSFELSTTHLSAQEGFNTLEISFSVSEAIAQSTLEDQNPLVTLGGAPLDLEEACDETEGTYNCSVTISGQEPEGLSLVQVQVQDLAGNYGYASQPLIIDFTAPSLLSAQLSPESAKLGDEVVLSLTFDEALESTPALLSDLPFEAIADSQYSYSFVVGKDPDVDLSAGPYNFDVTITDAVGNSHTISIFGESSDGGVGAGLQIDAIAPSLTPPVVNADRFSLNDGHNEISR